VIMSNYIQDLGADVRSPQATRFAEIVGFVNARRKAGKSDEEIIAILSKSSGLSRTSHPCADFDGNNICTQAEIAKAMGLAESVGIRMAEEVSNKKAGGSISPLFLVGGVAALWFLLKGKM